MIMFNESGAQKAENQSVMYTYKGGNQEQIDRHDHYLHNRLPDCDTFFVSSMAAQAGKAESTLRNYLHTDPTLGFHSPR